jgi:hypothetical protein
MGKFGRKTSAPPSAAPAATDDKWSIGSGEANGKPLIARWDLAAQRSCPDRARPIKITIGVQCVNAKPNGLPSLDDMALFEAMEEAMFAELPTLAGTSPVLVLTTNGMREWIIYARTHEWLGSWAPAFQERFMKGRPGKVEATEEPDWETFLEWTAT